MRILASQAYFLQAQAKDQQDWKDCARLIGRTNSKEQIRLSLL
jgi:hypothetical protein